MTYREEFPDFDPATLPTIPAGWADISWHNDACPSFDTGAGKFVYVDYADATLREWPESKRFIVMLDPEVRDGGDVLLATDDWSAVLAEIACAAPPKVAP